jgi:hypothetical protein
LSECSGTMPVGLNLLTLSLSCRREFLLENLVLVTVVPLFLGWLLSLPQEQGCISPSILGR